MTPEEKAYELFDKFYEYADSNYVASEFEKNWHGNVLAEERKVRKNAAKQCALIAVDEIIDANPNLKWFAKLEDSIKYWKEVKQEIEKL